MHTHFALVLQVLFHAALDAFRSPDGVNVSAESLLEECQQSIEDLSTMLFEYYGKVIAQPRRDLFSKATGLRVAQSSDIGFMTRVEADAAMESAKQAELLSVHANRSAPTGRPPFNKKAKGRGGGKGGGNRKVPLCLLPQQHQHQQHQHQQPQQRQQQEQQPSASLSATPAGSPRQQQSTLPCANPNKGGKGGKGKGQ